MREERRRVRRRRKLRLKAALLGRSRGGQTSKVHLAADRRCRPLAFILTAGQPADSPQLIPILKKVRVRGPVGRPRTRPDVLDRGRAILTRLCERVEADRPDDLAAFYALTHAATREFNALEVEFEAAGSEIETVAREEMGGDFWFIAQTYGFTDADPEELIATREW